MTDDVYELPGWWVMLTAVWFGIALMAAAQGHTALACWAGGATLYCARQWALARSELGRRTSS